MASSIRNQSLASLSQLIGLPLSAARRAADMRMFQLGPLRSDRAGSASEFALHVQCAWRIEGKTGIVTGRSDLNEPLEPDSVRSLNEWDYEQSRNLQDARIQEWLER